MKTQTPSNSMVADQVCEFYDRYPYPPPVNSLDDYRRRWEDEARRRADFHLFFPGKAYREDLSILVAGCGTSQAAKHALRQPTARVTAIDISATSIDHTRKLKDKYHLANLVVHQLPVERAHELEDRFDKVVCTGVLHHLSDADAGLRALRDVLEPDGALHLMVYASYGRAGIRMLQDYCRRLGIEPTDSEIQELAETLVALPAGHPLEYLLAETPDFRTKAGLADALLHPRDRSYTVPQLFDLIERGGLTFGRWVRQAPYLPQCGALARTPHCARLRQLTTEDQYAAVELFRGTMVRHAAIMYRNDRPGEDQSTRFDDKTWLAYVPIRLPGIRCIQERLPPGAAGVLLNRNHSYTDLYLPVEEAEKRWFDAIDGAHTIGEIVESISAGDSVRGHDERARVFFERLWWYDQVVFDQSRQSAQR